MRDEGGKSVTGKEIYFTFEDYYASSGICRWYYTAYTRLDGGDSFYDTRSQFSLTRRQKLNMVVFNLHLCLLLTVQPERNGIMHDAVSHKSRRSMRDNCEEKEHLLGPR